MLVGVLLQPTRCQRGPAAWTFPVSVGAVSHYYYRDATPRNMKRATLHALESGLISTFLFTRLCLDNMKFFACTVAFAAIQLASVTAFSLFKSEPIFTLKTW